MKFAFSHRNEHRHADKGYSEASACLNVDGGRSRTKTLRIRLNNYVAEESAGLCKGRERARFIYTPQMGHEHGETL